MKKVIGVGSAYKEESYAPPQVWPLDAIHGAEDDIVSLQKAKDSIEVLQGKGQAVKLIVVPDVKHEVSPEIADQILKSIYEVWPKI